jgi:hypothetical protein
VDEEDVDENELEHLGYGALAELLRAANISPRHGKAMPLEQELWQKVKPSGRVTYIVVLEGLCRFSVQKLSARGSYYVACVSRLERTKTELISVGAAESMNLLWLWKPPWPYILQKCHELVEDSAQQKCCGVDELYVKWFSLVCYDGCPWAYHSRCFGLNKAFLPQGQWFCPDCVIDKLGPSS